MVMPYPTRPALERADGALWAEHGEEHNKAVNSHELFQEDMLDSVIEHHPNVLQRVAAW